MSKVIALDIGTSSIGVAKSDVMRIIASPIGVVKYENLNKEKFIEEFLKLIQEHKPSEIVIGLPLNMDGSQSSTTIYIKDVVKLAKSKSNLPIHFIDERWTSKQAEKIIIQNNIKKTKRKSKNDEIAAAIILQTFLDSQQ